MSKSAKKRPLSLGSVSSAKSSQEVTRVSDHKKKKTDPGSKQSRVIAMLESPAGTNIATIMKATGWQQHSVRGFLAGVVRKRLKLKLSSNKVDGNRVYRITSGNGRKPASRTS
jgi:hypothetical protein